VTTPLDNPPVRFWRPVAHALSALGAKVDKVDVHIGASINCGFAMQPWQRLFLSCVEKPLAGALYRTVWTVDGVRPDPASRFQPQGSAQFPSEVSEQTLLPDPTMPLFGISLELMSCTKFDVGHLRPRYIRPHSPRIN